MKISSQSSVFHHLMKRQWEAPFSKFIFPQSILYKKSQKKPLKYNWSIVWVYSWKKNHLFWCLMVKILRDPSWTNHLLTFHLLFAVEYSSDRNYLILTWLDCAQGFSQNSQDWSSFIECYRSGQFLHLRSKSSQKFRNVNSKKIMHLTLSDLGQIPKV